MFKRDHGVTFWKPHNWWCQENRRNTSHLNCLSLSLCPPSPQSHGIAPALVWVRPLVGMGLVLFSEVNTYPRRMCYIWIIKNAFFKCKKHSHHIKVHRLHFVGPNLIIYSTVNIFKREGRNFFFSILLFVSLKQNISIKYCSNNGRLLYLARIVMMVHF